MLNVDEIPLHLTVELSSEEKYLLAQARCIVCGLDLELRAVVRCGRITCSNGCRQKRYRSRRGPTRPVDE